MALTLLQIVTYQCNRTGIPAPTSIIGTSDAGVLQLLRLLEEEGNELAERGDWNVLTYEATHTTVATASQGAITTIAPTSYRHILNDTIWDRSGKLPIYPVDDEEWQAIQAMAISTTPYRYRLRGGLLYATPTPPAGLTWAFEYISKAWISGSASTKLQYFAADTDTTFLPDDLLLMGLRWRYLKEKGLEYAEQFRTYELQVKYYLSTEKPYDTLNASENNSRRPGFFLPAMTWVSP